MRGKERRDFAICVPVGLYPGDASADALFFRIRKKGEGIDPGGTGVPCILWRDQISEQASQKESLQYLVVKCSLAFCLNRRNRLPKFRVIARSEATWQSPGNMYSDRNV